MLPKINLYSVLFIIALVFVLGFSINPGETDTEQTEDLAHEVIAAKKRWISEHGDAQPNLTPATEKYLKEMTEQIGKNNDKN